MREATALELAWLRPWGGDVAGWVFYGLSGGALVLKKKKGGFCPPSGLRLIACYALRLRKFG